MATSPAEKARQEAQRKIYAEAVALPAEESRKLAVAQQAKFEARLLASRDKLGTLTGRWRQFQEDAEAIAQHIAWGDELSAKTDEQSRKVRRQQYSRAYLRGRTAAQNLDDENKDGTTAQVFLRDAIKATAETAETVAKKTAETVTEIASETRTGLYVGLAGLVAALLLYANQKGKR